MTPKPLFWAKPGFLMWTAGAEDPAAEEARLAAADPEFAQAKADFDASRKSLAHASES